MDSGGVEWRNLGQPPTSLTETCHSRKWGRTIGMNILKGVSNTLCSWNCVSSAPNILLRCSSSRHSSDAESCSQGTNKQNTSLLLPSILSEHSLCTLFFPYPVWKNSTLQKGISRVPVNGEALSSDIHRSRHALLFTDRPICHKVLLCLASLEGVPGQ